MADATSFVLDLSSTPPNIYNEDGTENVHNAFQSPYPYIFWAVNNTNTDVIHGGQLQSHTPALTTPYPNVFWFTNNTNTDIIHSNQLKAQPMGAFVNASNLTNIQFPKSLTYLGTNVATNTSLTNVTIPSTCTYDVDTTFPSDCTVNFFPNE